MTKRFLQSQLLLCSLLVFQWALAAEKPASQVPQGGSNPAPYNTNGITVNPNCATGTSNADLDINNVRARYLNAGDMFWDPGASQPRYEVPKRTDLSTTAKHSMFAAAIWLGGVEKGTDNLVVMVQTYRQGGLRNYWPGPIQYTNNDCQIPSSANICSAWNQHFKCNRRTVKEFVDLVGVNGTPLSIAQIPREILYWPGKGNPHLKQKSEFAADPCAKASIDNNLANFFDADSNGIYTPTGGDYPLWAGTEKDTECEGTEININAGADQVLWWVCNDVGNTKNFSSNTTPVPGIGMEIHYEAFAYASTDATNDMTFLRQRLFNKGSYILENTYLSQWADPDLGNANDDYVGCDVRRGLGICYNGDDNDEGVQGYGVNPPSIGVDFFRGPFPDDKYDDIDWNLNCRGPQSAAPDTNERIIMSGFVYYNNSTSPINGDPDKAADFYNFMRNRWKNGNDISFGGQGTDPVGPTKPKAIYMFPNVTAGSDPYGYACGNVGCTPKSCGPVWNENTSNNAPGDRRFLANNGPFTLKPGAFNECTIGIVWARATSGGALGSFGKLLAADDLAQERFDECFKRNVGPNNPNLEIIEGDEDLVFTIIPDVIRKEPLMTTESYVERNNKVQTGNDLFYRFQGYKIYQLADDKVSVQELDNPDRARLLQADVNGDGVNDINGIMDIRDGVTSISNLEFNATLESYISTPKVKNTPDRGIFHSFRVNKDAFASSGLGGMSNFKKYYFTIIAYGYHNNELANTPYIQGVENYKIYTAIPHKSDPEAFGTIAKAGFGSGFEISKLFGTGNSGNELEFASGVEDQILAQNSLEKVTYRSDKSPIDIKVYNPKALKNARFRLKLSSRLRYNANSSNYAFQIGDTILADNNLVLDDETILNPRTSFKPGRAIIKRINAVPEQKGIFDLDIDLLCDNDSISGGAGSFAYEQDLVVESSGKAPTLEERTRKVCRFYLSTDQSKSAQGLEYFPYDYWQLTTPDVSGSSSVYSDLPISSVTEQLLPDYGISIRLKPGINAGSDPYNPLSANGMISSDIIYDLNPLLTWLTPVPGSAFGWLRSDPEAFEAGYYTIDPRRNFSIFGDECWYPYVMTTNTLEINQGPQIPATNDAKASYGPKNPLSMQNMVRLQNVDIVLTSDKSKWTRCAVLQLDTVGATGATKTRFSMIKSRKPSVNKDYAVDPSMTSPYNGNPSKGMSWFPGYAIDLDRGVRLNLMFSESALADTLNGNDLIYNPGVGNGTKHFVYVMRTTYDEGRSTERALDSIYGNFSTIQLASYLGRYRNWTLKNIQYVGLMARATNLIDRKPQGLNLSDMRIKLRVERSFQSYSPAGYGCSDSNPLFEFVISGNSVVRNDINTGKSALDLIRVVPNPYLAVSGYENSQIDNRVKIVNLPSQCVISIFNLSGSLIRQFNFDQSSTAAYAANAAGRAVINERGTNYQTYLDWDLKNQSGIPIASGVYLIHIKSDKLGERTLKWFGVLRPIDLDSFN